MSLTIELIIMIASIMLMCIILINVIVYRKERGIKYLIGVIACRIIYSSGIVLEKSSYELAEKIIFRNLYQTALILMVPFFVLFTLELIGRDKLAKPLWKLVFLLFFGIWSLLLWFNSEFHIVYRNIELINDRLIIERTMVATYFNIFCYALIAICFYFFLQYIRNIRQDLRRPILLVLFLSSFSFIFEILRFVNPTWSTWLLPLSVYCGFIGMVMLVIMLRAKFFQIVPFERNMVFENLQDRILITNASGKVIDNNKQAAEWFAQLGHTEITGRPLVELIAPWPNWKALSERMDSGNVEIEACLDGERKVYSVNVYPIGTERKQGQGSISIIYDITEKQRNLEKIVELSNLKDQLVTIVSHDIRTPLALQHQLVEVLEEDKESFQEEHQEIINMLSVQTSHTLGMTNNLLEWFRSQREDLALHSSKLHLAQVIEECCQSFSILSESKEITVAYHIADDLQVHGDREVLALIVRNLLSNAIKFTPSGGSIEVAASAEASDDTVVISVSDNGIGMDTEQIKQIFELQQLNSQLGTNGEKGSGLGLLVSRQFVERVGGKLWVNSMPGQGSSFHFTMKGGKYCESDDRR